ncbi:MULTISPECIES: hypothetical protein [unclassified Clostridium]|uniref:hypothetical protein n=1 Tax=unclassified Clostridium TaxID=2614128 RepID=UPI00207A03D7|nr:MULTISPECIES: hypothetical protein [unclassified Clostridium]
MPQIITTQDSDSKGNIIHTETEASVVTYKDNDTVENNLNNLNNREELFVTDTKPIRKGFWINRSEQVIGKGSDTIVDRLKRYMDSKIGILSGLLTKNKSNVVEAINEVYDKVESIPNSNLLDNGDFQIWTNGTSFNIEPSYTIFTCDKFKIWNNGKEKIQISKVENGMRVIGSNNTTIYFNPKKKITNRQLSFSISIDDKKYSFTFNHTTDGEWHRVNFFNEENFSFNYINYDFEVFSKKNDFTINWIKLELGNEATPFVSKSYEEEFNNCIPYRNVLSNPNLLINGDFRIHQRDDSFILDNTSKYTFDRWKAGGLQKLGYSESSLFIKTFSDERYCAISQPILVSELGYRIKDKLTLSVYLNSPQANIKSKIAIILYDDDLKMIRREDKPFITGKEWEPSLISLTIDTNGLTKNGRIDVYIMESKPTIEQSIYYLWTKLECGSVATPFIPRSYGEDLALCQRYYLPISATQRCRSIMVNNNVIMCELPTPTTMRINPTLVKNPNVDDNRNIEVARLDGTLETGFAITYDLVANAIRVKATKVNHGLTDATINFNNKGFDSEIY